MGSIWTALGNRLETAWFADRKPGMRNALG